MENDATPALNIIMLPTEAYPTNRALLIELWNNEMTKRGHHLHWIMQPSDRQGKRTKTSWNSSPVYLTRKERDRSIFSSLMNGILCIIDKYAFVKAILKDEKIDIIQVRNGILEGFIALFFKNRRGLVFSFHYSSMHGFWGKQFSSWKPRSARMVKVLKDTISSVLYRFLLSRADAIQPISRWMKEEIVRMGIANESILPTPLSASGFFLNYSGPPARIFDEYPHFVKIIYCGSPGKSRNLDLLIESFALVRKEHENVILFLLGDVAGHKDKKHGHVEHLSRLADMHDILDGVIFLGQVPYEEVPHYLTGADIGVSPIPPQPYFRISSPSKCVEYLSVGLPVVANKEIFDQYEVITRSGGGMAVEYSREDFARGLLLLLKDPATRERMSRDGKRWVMTHRTYASLAERLEAEYVKVLARTC